MRRNTTFARGSAIPAATLNAVQDEQSGLIRATAANGAPALTGADGRHWCTPDAGVPDGTIAVVDATAGLDWRARLLWGTWTRLETAAQRLQGADAWQGNDVARPIAMKRFHGRTGTGGKGAADATVADGTPPVVASGSFAVIIDELSSTSQRVYLYARPGDHALCLYNASGATLHGELLVHGAGVSPTLGSPPPSPVPTLTDVLWLDPGLAADRPADPGGPAIYRSTDTGAVEIWDGGAWRSMGGGGGGGAPTGRRPALPDFGLLWECDETSGDFINTGTVGTSANLTTIGSGVARAQLGPITVGRGARFDGTTNGHAKGAAGVTPGTGSDTSLTVFALAVVEGNPGSARRDLISRSFEVAEYPLPYVAATITIYTDTSWLAKVGISGSYVEVFSDIPYQLGRQHLFGLTYDGADVCLWLDGVLAKREAHAGVISWGTGTGMWLLGSNPSTGASKSLIARAGAANVVWGADAWGELWQRTTGNWIG